MKLNPCACGSVPSLEYGYSKAVSTKKHPLNLARVQCDACKKRTGDMVYNADNSEDETITLKAIAEVWNAGAYG